MQWMLLALPCCYRQILICKDEGRVTIAVGPHEFVLASETLKKVLGDHYREHILNFNGFVGTNFETIADAVSFLVASRAAKPL